MHYTKYACTTLAKKKTATTIMHKIRTLFLSYNITRLARWRGLPRLCASMHRSTIKLDFSIPRDKKSVLILCIIVAAVCFGQRSTWAISCPNKKRAGGGGGSGALTSHGIITSFHFFSSFQNNMAKEEDIILAQTCLQKSKCALFKVACGSRGRRRV